MGGTVTIVFYAADYVDVDNKPLFHFPRKLVSERSNNMNVTNDRVLVEIRLCADDAAALERYIEEHDDLCSPEDIIMECIKQQLAIEESREKRSWQRRHPLYFYDWFSARNHYHFCFRKVKEQYGPNAGKFHWYIEEIVNSNLPFPMAQRIDEGTCSTRKVLLNKVETKKRQLRIVKGH